ncbi:MAG TPA: sigma factor-like helix-turn-helix DNA-binding protein [Chloroflexota bacterium]|nr:sigma factor-like helix-turn-helix DNA-binding protein [Chloroflexota bacterium]
MSLLSVRQQVGRLGMTPGHIVLAADPLTPPAQIEGAELDGTGTSAEAVQSAKPAVLGELERILALLPTNERRVVELRFREGRTIKQIARALRVSDAAAKVLQYQAVQRADAVGAARQTYLSRRPERLESVARQQELVVK